MSDVASTRFATREKQQVERASRRLGVSRSEFIRQAALGRAAEVLARRDYSRAELVNRISASERCPWARRELQSKSLDDLKKIDRLMNTFSSSR